MQRLKLTAEQQKWLDRELALWQTEQVVSVQQAELIRNRYESADEIHERKRSAAVQALFGMAAFLFGLAVLLLIGFNWDHFPREGKLVIVLGVIAATHLGALRIRRHEKHIAVSETISFMGCLFFGAGIWLIAQAFHLEAHYPDGVWWWALGVLPFALCLNSLPLHLLYAALLALWGSMEVLGFSHLSPWWAVNWWYIPNGAYLLPFMAAPGLIWAYHRKSETAIGVYVALLAWWTVLLAFAMRLDGRAIFWIGNVGAILILFAEAHRPRDPRGIPYRFCGVFMVSGILLAMGSMSFWQGMAYMQAGWDDVARRNSALIEIVGTGGLLTLAAALLFIFRGIGAFDLKGEAGEADSVRRRWFAIILVGSFMIMSIWSLTISSPELACAIPIAVSNLVSLGMALYLVKVGEQEERTRPFSAGVLMFLMWALIRYIDLFAEAGGMLGAALLFALCGGGLIVVGNFWSRKRQAREQASGLRPAESLQTPPWVNSTIEWFAARRTAIVTIAAIAQIGLLGGMILIESLPLMVGERIVLAVKPVDPRDFFRGDYVILNYDVNSMVISDGEKLILPWNRSRTYDDQAVYVELEQVPGSGEWTGKQATITRPTGVKYLRGRITSDYRQPLKFGIEAYFVQEGQGRELELQRNERKLKAEIAVAPWGQAKLVRVFE